MEIIGSSREKSTVYIAVLTLAVVGLALVLSTWQILRRQKAASMEHLELTSIAVLQAVDSSLRRGPMMGANRFSSDTREFFRDLENNGDILFVGIVDDKGARLLAEGDTGKDPVLLPESAVAALKQGSRWQGMARYGQRAIYIAARPIQNPSAPMRRREGSRHHRNDAGMGAPFAQAAQSGHFLMVAVDMEKHFAVFEGFKRTAIFQMTYILAAAAFLWILAARLISRRKLAGKALYLERLQARLIDNLPDGLLIADESGSIHAANPAARAILAKHGDSLIGKNLADISQSFSAPLSGTRSNGWQQAAFDGMQLEIRGLPFQGEGDTASLMVIVRDRTRIRTLEKNLAEAEKLAAIGSLAAGVAHEIRNPLSALRGFAQYFAKKLAGRQPEEEYAQTMVREADRLNRVITDLLYLARPRDLAPGTTDLAAICAELETLLRIELGEQRIHLACALDAPTVTADPDALKQALLNLLLNALEAMAGTAETGGKPERRAITLSSARGVRDEAEGVWLTVADTGPGMTEEERVQACKPFFTTKKKGTGLGLALVQTIMHGHGGDIAIASPVPSCTQGGDTDGGPGGGCAVSLFFPDAAPPAGSDA